MDKISQKLGTKTGIKTLSETNKELVTDGNKDIVENKTKNLKEMMALNKEKDYLDARKNIKEMIQSSMELVPDLVSLLRETENAKSYDSAANFMKMITDLNKSLLSLSDVEESKSKSKDTSNTPQNIEPQVQQTNVYIGTTEDMLDSLSKNKESKAIDVEYKEVKDKK